MPKRGQRCAEHPGANLGLGLRFTQAGYLWECAHSSALNPQKLRGWTRLRVFFMVSFLLHTAVFCWPINPLQKLSDISLNVPKLSPFSAQYPSIPL